MPAFNKESIQRLQAAGLYPPRHPQGCPQNFLRVQVGWLYQAGKSDAEIKDFLEKALPAVDHGGHS